MIGPTVKDNVPLKSSMKQFYTSINGLIIGSQLHSNGSICDERKILNVISFLLLRPHLKNPWIMENMLSVDESEDLLIFVCTFSSNDSE